MTVVEPYQYSRADGVAVASPLFQVEGDGSTPISALQLRFTPIGYQTARRLNRLWHSVLPSTPDTMPSVIPVQSYVAEYLDHWYGVAIWSSPVNAQLMACEDMIFELRRMALCPVAPKNTASRMLAFMRRDLHRRFPSLARLISYQATNHHQGTIYRAAGWRPVGFNRGHAWALASRWRPENQMTSDTVRWECDLA